MAIVYLNATFIGAGSASLTSSKSPKVEVTRGSAQSGAVTLAIDTTKVSNAGWVRRAVQSFLENLASDGTVK